MLIFVYGTLKKGFSNNTLLKTSKFIKKYTLTGKYQMINVNNAFPAVILSKNINKIKGEIWDVNQETLDDIDALEGVPYLYNRRHFRYAGMNCWIYIMKRDIDIIPVVIKTGEWTKKSRYI